MNTLAQVLLFSRNSLAVITSTVMMSFLAVEGAKAQPTPSCFMINTSGEVVDLTDICNVKPQRQLRANAVTRIGSAINSTFTPERTEIPNRPAEFVYFVANGSVPFTLGTSSASYYTGRRSAYVRRYNDPERFINRDNARDALLGSGANPTKGIITGRSPFVIYRYQKRNF